MIAFHDAVPRVARVQVLPSALTSTHARPTSSDAVPDTFRGPGATRAPGPGETIAMGGPVVPGPALDLFGLAGSGRLRGPVPTPRPAAPAEQYLGPVGTRRPAA